MRTQKKIRNTLLCVLTAFTVLMLLTVLPFAETVAFNDTAGDSQRSESTQANTSHEAASSEKAVSSKESASSEEATSSGETVSSEKPVSSEEAISSEGPASSEEPASGGETASSQRTDAGTPAKTTSAVSALQTGEYQYQDSDIVASVTLSDASAIPGDAQLHVVPITEEKSSAKYREVETQVAQNVQDENQKVTGFLAYDIYFMANGTRYEPEDGNATVTIQYKKELFAPAVKQATDEIKVLHLKDTGDGTEVEDVTKSVDVADLGSDRQTESESAVSSETSSAASSGPSPESGSEVGSESDSQASSDADSVPDDADTVEFETGSFSVFVVTGVGSGSASLQTSLTFRDTGENTDTSVSGTYYLYIECGNYDGYGNAYHNTLKLVVSGGTVTADLTGLYDQNGNKMNNNQGELYRLIDGSYTAILFHCNDSTFSTQYPDDWLCKFKWDSNSAANYHCVKYEQGDEIADNYTVSDFPGTVTVTDGSGALVIAAAAKAGTGFSYSGIMSRLSPVLPFGVFADYFDLSGSEVIGCIAANSATISGNFGNRENIGYYLGSTNTITVNKTYNGSTQKTFRFGLFHAAADSSATDQSGVHVKTLTLPNGGSSSGTVTFDIGSENVADYTVHELDGSDNIIAINGTYDGFTLTKADPGTKTTSSTFNWTSYINSFLSDSTGGQLYGDTSKLVVGSGTVKIDSNGRPYVTLPNGNTITCNGNSVSMERKDSSQFPFQFSEVFNNMKTLSTDFAQALTTDTVVVKNFKASDFTKSENNRFTFTVNNNQMLLINIDATGCSEFSFPSDSQMKINDQSSGGWEQIAKNIIVNIFTKSADSNGTVSYNTYEGKVTNAWRMMGTILAPDAEVHVTSGAYNGRIVAKKIYNDSREIHSCATGTSGENRPWTFINTENANYITLPETGGTGSGLFFSGGGALVLLAAAWAAFRLMRRKKGAHAGTGPFQIFSRALLPRGGPALHWRADGGSG